MKQLFKGCLAGLLFLAISLPIVAQEGPMPPYTAMHVENVKPGMIDEYVEGTKKWIEAIKKEGIGLFFFCFRDKEGNYHYGVPYSKWADVDELQEKWGKAAAILRNTDWGRKRQAAINWSRYESWFHAAHLSYMPKEPSENPMELMYSGWANVRVSHTNESKFNELMLQLKGVYEEYGITRGYNVYRNILGVNGPFYVIVWSAKDPADMYKWQQESWAKLGEATKPIFDQLMDIAEEMQEGNGWVMPELSLMPEGM